MDSGKAAENRKYISIKGAKLHNLKNISVDIPRNKFTVITGVSGSGKSSLAFDTIYAEGQRRFVESLSAYARQFLERMSKPDVESISGIPPAIAIEQSAPQKNPRSTVGTSTEIYDYLRVLYARLGTTICHVCGRVVRKDTAQSVVDEILTYDEGDKLYILFPLSAQVAKVNDELARYGAMGYFRYLIKGSDQLYDSNEDKLPKKTKAETVFMLADRLALGKDEDGVTRLTDSVENAFVSGTGRIMIRNISKGIDRKYSVLFECAECERIFAEPEPRLFSFNNPHGACPSCQGFGRTIGIDDDLVFPDRTKSINNNAIHPFKTPGNATYLRALLDNAAKYGVPVNAPVSTLTDEQMKIVMDGTPDGEYIGINGFFKMLEDKSYKIHYRVLLSRYRGYTKCKACGGSRIRTSARQVFIQGVNIPMLIQLPLNEVLDFFKNIKLTEYEENVAGQVLKEVGRRVELLVDIGLDYLSLSRMMHTLSGGESQRINLSTALGSSLVGALYVLDEPSVGLHARDTSRLLQILYKLRNLGNTIIVVEHDPDIIRHADNVIDMGPKAGEYGGEIIYSGNYAGLLESPTSLTAMYFTGKSKVFVPRDRRKTNIGRITIDKPRSNNLKMDKIEIPLGCMTVLTGVSGSGKSSLIMDVLYYGLKKMRGVYDGESGAFENITGAESIDLIELVDQSPIGRTSRSTPATYSKVFDGIREIFASTQAAKQMGWKPGHFSFNVSGGRCDVCEGEGVVRVDMQFLPDVHLECESCHGTRYKKEARNILYKNKSIIDVLDMSVDEALEFFDGTQKITKKLALLSEVGLGYLRLGQSGSMLSGGEAQRIKLAGHLDSSASTQCLYIFDEPTTGLHLDDISKLMACFNRLVDNGNTVIIIEHNLEIIAAADWVIDLGPDAGARGGLIVAVGTPEKIAKCKTSHTGIAIKEYFERIGLMI